MDHEVDPSIIMFFPQQAVSYYQTRLAAAQTTGDQLKVMMPYALALLNAGQSEAALQQLDSLQSVLTKNGYVLDPRLQASLLETKALTYLRIGEQENCLYNHNADSCLLPIQGGGVHVRTRGSRGAIAVLDELLAQAPTPYAAWLLNIAYMTLGEYPDQVPLRWRIAAGILRVRLRHQTFPRRRGSARTRCRRPLGRRGDGRFRPRRLARPAGFRLGRDRDSSGSSTTTATAPSPTAPPTPDSPA